MRCGRRPPCQSLRSGGCAHDHPHAVEHLVYEGAGHVIGPPVPGLTFSMTHAVHPILGIDFAFGGDPGKSTSASLDSWARILSFLDAVFAAL
jgi:hypothetical protein